MTTVKVIRDERGVRSITVSGHAGYDARGKDIVCAAASVLIITCANALESVAKLAPLVSERAQPAEMTVSLPSGLTPEQDYDAQIILQTVLQGYTDIAAQYPRHLKII